jgi:hypothetical protein
VIPPKADAEFVAAMEDVLEVDHRPYDEARPLVCLDEASKPLVGEVIEPIPAEPGQPERFDYEYIRDGTADLFMVTMPLLSRSAEVFSQRPWNHLENKPNAASSPFYTRVRNGHQNGRIPRGNRGLREITRLLIGSPCPPSDARRGKRRHSGS